jgi:hypothetical protein
MKYIIKESQYVYLLENLEKKKRLFTKVLGEDLINSIREITSPNQLPIEFLKSIGTSIIQRYIDVYGPLYYFVLDGEPFLYKERISPSGEEYEMYINNKGKSFLEGEITEILGLSDMGLNFSDVIDTFHNEGEPLNESVEKNKKFLTKLMGVDFTGNIEQVTSTYDVPMEFDNNISPAAINYYLNKFGPMYLFELDGIKYLYQDQDHGDFFIDDYGFYYNDEIPEQLGIDDLGLRFSDIINIFFNEEDDVITEDENKELRNKVQRRLGTIDQYIGEMDPNDVCDYWTKGEVDYYVVSSMQNVVEKICDEIGSYDLYDEIYEYISNQGYKTYFRDFFFDTIDNYCTEQKHN